MSEAGDGNGSRLPPRPRLPWVITAASLVVAVGAVSALLVVLYRETTGPGEVVHGVYELVAEGDCAEAARAFAPEVRPEGAAWCAERAELLGREVAVGIVEVRTAGDDLDHAEVEAVVERTHEGEGGATACRDSWALERSGGGWTVTALEPGPCR